MRESQLRVRRLLAALAVVFIGFGVGLAPAAPAMAGGWASTLLDPLPERLEPGRAYTVGFWLLQHGVRPLPVDVAQHNQVGIRLVGEQGQTHLFPGVALTEPGHYAAAVVIPEAGSWRVRGAQGGYPDFEVGVVRAPGALEVLPVPAVPPTDSPEWTGPVRPPQVPVDPARDPFETEQIAYTWDGSSAVANGRSAAPASAVGDPVSTPEQGAGSTGRLATIGLVAVGLLAAAAFPALYLRRRPTAS